MIAESILNRLAERLAHDLAPPRGSLVPLVVDAAAVGYATPSRAGHLATFAGVFESSGGALHFAPGLDTSERRTAALEPVLRALADQGHLTAWRNERYAVRAPHGGDILFDIERAAARYFGIATFAAHLNGVVRTRGEPRMWIARRSPHKAIDPGRLDNLVGGGVAAGETVEGTLVREAQEEAGIAAGMAARASRDRSLCIFREQPDGVQRETIHPFDLVVPADFTPRNGDGEIAEFRLLALDDVARCAAEREGSDAMTADASLVVADWLMRHGFVPRDSAAWRALDALRRPPLEPGG